MRQLELELLLPGEHAWNCTCDECEELFEVTLPEDWNPQWGEDITPSPKVGGKCLPRIGLTQLLEILRK